MIRKACEQWGNIWPKRFTERNITPKGHILSFVLPKSCEELKTFYKFYKVGQKGEEIHASMNDIDRKAWVIKNEGARLWKLVEQYQLRNVTTVEIAVPMRRVFRKDHLRKTKYILRKFPRLEVLQLPFSDFQQSIWYESFFWLSLVSV